MDSVIQPGQCLGGIDGVAAVAQGREEKTEGIGKMTPITDQQWKAYELTHPDHGGMDLEDAAKEMGLSVEEVTRILWWLKQREPDLFTDISSDGRMFNYGVSRFSGWCEGKVVKKF